MADVPRLTGVCADTHKFPIQMEAENSTKVVLTPHDASYTEEAYHALRVKTAENAAAVHRGAFPRYLVNPEIKARARLNTHRNP